MSEPGTEPGRPAVFLDRDGTIIREVDYLSRPDQVELLPGAVEGLRALSAAGYALVLVTNQSGIARGLFSEAELAEIHARLRDDLAAQDVRLDHYGYCPHHPVHAVPGYRCDCECRKPKPGLLERATRLMDLDPSSSWMIGDSARDLDAGEAHGTQTILVRTGKGEQELARLLEEAREPERVAEDLAEAARMILEA